MHIRPTKLDDAPAIHRVSKSLGYEAVEEKLSARWLSLALQTGRDRVWVGESDGCVVGWIHAFATLRLASPPFAEIGGLAVSRDARRQGVGRALVMTAKAWADELQLPLRVRVNAKREDANQFYQAMGMTLCKDQRVWTFDS